MVVTSLLIASLADLLLGGLFAYIGRVVQRRTVRPDARLASRAFSLWWYGIGFLVAVEGGRGIVGAFGLLDRAALHLAFVVIYELWIVVLSAAMGGLLLYLAYLYRGNTRAAVPLAAFYGAWAAVAVWQTIGAGPTFVASGLVTLVRYEIPLASGIELAFFLFLYAPQIVAIALYLGLYPRVPTREARVRMLAIGAGLAVWLGANLLAALLGAIETDAWQIAKRVLGLAVSLAILASYGPPTPLGRAKPRHEHDARADAMAQRVRELV